MLERQEEEYRRERSSLQSLLQQQGESQSHYQELLQDADKERSFLLQKNEQLRQRHEQMEQHVSQVLQQLVDEKEEREKAVKQLKSLRRKLGGGGGGQEKEEEEGEGEEEDPLKQQLLTLQQEVTVKKKEKRKKKFSSSYTMSERDVRVCILSCRFRRCMYTWKETKRMKSLGERETYRACVNPNALCVLLLLLRNIFSSSLRCSSSYSLTPSCLCLLSLFFTNPRSPATLTKRASASLLLLTSPSAERKKKKKTKKRYLPVFFLLFVDRLSWPLDPLLHYRVSFSGREEEAEEENTYPKEKEKEREREKRKTRNRDRRECQFTMLKNFFFFFFFFFSCFLFVS